jgi:hypothetical protein
MAAAFNKKNTRKGIPLCPDIAKARRIALPMSLLERVATVIFLLPDLGI